MYRGRRVRGLAERVLVGYFSSQTPRRLQRECNNALINTQRERGRTHNSESRGAFLLPEDEAETE